MRILLVSGSLRAGSTNSAVLRTAASLAPSGVHCVVYEGIGSLPHFNPDADREPLASVVADLRREIGAADAILFCTPEYAGALPGSFKNLLDWSVGGDAEIHAKPIGWINAAGVAAPNGGSNAHDSLRKVLGYVGARIVEPACVRIPLARSAVGADGLIADAEVRERVAGVLCALAGFVVQQTSDPPRDVIS